LGVAVSGGADSVFLLRALRSLGLAAVVLHVNHKLRGAESDADEAFVRELAGELGLPVVVSSEPLPEGNTEQEARRVRYRFFQEQTAAGRCNRVATGHTLDDQAETVLYRFLRGAGTAGLSGIRPVTEAGIVRPLLELRREEIRQWLRDNGHPWREDSSNADMEFRRNQIRCQYLPELTATMNPALAETLASTAVWAQAEEDYWAGELTRLDPQLLERGAETVLIRCERLLAEPVAVQRRVLRRGIEHVRGSLRSIDFRHVEGIRGLMVSKEGSGRIQLPGLDIYRSFDWLRLAPVGFDARIERNFEAALLIPGRTRVLAPAITIESELSTESGVYTDGVVDQLDWGRCAGSLLLRNWRPGDRYESQVSSGAEKIKTLFQEFRVPLWERRSWPVITLDGSEGSPIVWSRGFGVARQFKAGSETRETLVIREVRESKYAVPASHVLNVIELKRAHRRPQGEPGAEVL
jgi:tRNA(Ile)-lysidine synthase